MLNRGPGGSISKVVGIPNNSCKPITNTAWVRSRFSKLQKVCTRIAAASDKAYQLLAHGRWLSPGTPSSSTTKTGRHDIADILLKKALNTKKSNQSNQPMLNTNTTGVTSGVGTTHTTGTPAFILGCRLFGFPVCFTLSVPDEG